MVVIWRKALTDEKKSDASCMLGQSRLGTHSELKTNNSSAPQTLDRYAQTLCRTAGQKKKCLSTSSWGQIIMPHSTLPKAAFFIGDLMGS